MGPRRASAASAFLVNCALTSDGLPDHHIFLASTHHPRYGGRLRKSLHSKLISMK